MTPSRRDAPTPGSALRVTVTRFAAAGPVALEIVMRPCGLHPLRSHLLAAVGEGGVDRCGQVYNVYNVYNVYKLPPLPKACEVPRVHQDRERERSRARSVDRSTPVYTPLAHGGDVPAPIEISRTAGVRDQLEIRPSQREQQAT